MLYYILKFTISAILIVAISEISKRYSLTAGILASLPIVSVLGMIWLYIDTASIEKLKEIKKKGIEHWVDKQWEEFVEQG